MPCHFSTSFASGNRFYQHAGDRRSIRFFPDGQVEWQCASGAQGRGSAEVRVPTPRGGSAGGGGGGGGTMQWTVTSAKGVQYASVLPSDGTFVSYAVCPVPHAPHEWHGRLRRQGVHGGGERSRILLKT
jgi:hypothetical protein